MSNMKKKLDYKWVIVALCFLMVLSVLGFCSSNKGMYVSAITEALGISRAKFLLNDSCRFVTTAVINLFFGTLVAKYGTKKLICAGFVSLIASCTMYSVATNVYMIYVGGVLLGLGLSWTTTTMVSCVVNKWCKENKGTIMGLVLASNGIGGAIAAQIVVPIIESQKFGYKNAYRLVSAILLVVLVLIIVFFRENPKNFEGQTVVAKKKGRGQHWEGIAYSDALKKGYFYAVAVCIFITGFVLSGVNGISYDHMKMSGVSGDFIKHIVTLHSLSLAGFKFLTGFMYDKMGLRKTMNICSAAAMIAMLSLAFVTGTKAGAVLAMVYGVISSLALPLETIMVPIYAADLFGQKSFDQILGKFVSFNVFGFALGSPIMGACFDKFGTYKPALIAASAVMIVVIIAMQFVLNAAEKTRSAIEQRGMENE